VTPSVIKTQWSTNPLVACNTSEVKPTTSVLSVDPKVVVKRDAQDVIAFICLTRSSRGEIAAENVGSDRVQSQRELCCDVVDQGE
jgi:hypothetical protein